VSAGGLKEECIYTMRRPTVSDGGRGQRWKVKRGRNQVTRKTIAPFNRGKLGAAEELVDGKGDAHGLTETAFESTETQTY